MSNTVLAGLMIVAALCCAAAPATQDARFLVHHSKENPWGFAPDFADKAAWEKRADFLKHQVLVAQGLWPMPEKLPLNAQIYGRIERDVYTIEKVYFTSTSGHYVTGNLYRPKNRTGPLPAVLCPYGHWPAGRFIWKAPGASQKEIDAGAETDPIAAKTPLQANCAMLARMGCIVFQYDMVGFGDSTVIHHMEGFTDAEAVMRLQSFMGLQTWNSIRAYDFVSTLPDVDPNRIAVTGSSSGGTQTIALDAADGRANVAFPMVMVSMNSQGGCICENAPLYRVGTNNVELAALFAPKPEGMASANDWTRDFMTRGLPEMKSIWTLFGKADDVWGGHVNFGHNHNLPSREMQYAFLNEHLKLGWPTPVKEQPFEPVPPKELSVWDADHPLPVDFVGAPELRRRMTAASDAQLAALDRATFARTLKTALEAMVVDQLPQSSEVECGEGWIARKGSGERVPTRVVLPKNFNGTIVIVSSTPDEEQMDKFESAHCGVLQVAPFMSEAFSPPPTTAPAAKPTTQQSYPGYTLGYERSVLANRVHDLLTAIAYADSLKGVADVRLLGCGRDDVALLLARILAGDRVSRMAVDLKGFDFAKIADPVDPMLLPGALKYGGVGGLASICRTRASLVRGLSTEAAVGDAKTVSAAGVKMIDWILR